MRDDESHYCCEEWLRRVRVQSDSADSVSRSKWFSSNVALGRPASSCRLSANAQLSTCGKKDQCTEPCQERASAIIYLSYPPRNLPDCPVTLSMKPRYF